MRVITIHLLLVVLLSWICETNAGVMSDALEEMADDFVESGIGTRILMMLPYGKRIKKGYDFYKNIEKNGFKMEENYSQLELVPVILGSIVYGLVYFLTG